MVCTRVAVAGMQWRPRDSRIYGLCRKPRSVPLWASKVRSQGRRTRFAVEMCEAAEFRDARECPHDSVLIVHRFSRLLTLEMHTLWCERCASMVRRLKMSSAMDDGTPMADVECDER